MTGDEAMEGIIEALKLHHRKNPNANPSKLQLPWGLAYDLVKLGRVELGELADKIMLEGLAVLERQGFRGFVVTIDWKNQYGDVVAT
jgi:hypothetical protein